MSHLLETHYGGFRSPLPGRGLVVGDTSGLKVRVEVDPRLDLPVIFNQWQLGSCTANATDAAFEYDASLDGKTVTLSRMWTYYQERKKEGELGQGDTGAVGHDAFWVAKNSGICSEKDWPYKWPGMQEGSTPSELIFDPKVPPASALSDQDYYRLTKPYVQLPRTEAAIKQALSNNQTVAFGFTVYESFESSSVASSGIVPMPAPDEKVLGGHEVLVVGYLKSEPHYALVRNSWGTSWGQSGYCLFPWTYLIDKSLTSDLVTIVRSVA